MRIASASELITSRSEIRQGFIEAALEKNRRAQPYIKKIGLANKTGECYNIEGDIKSISWNCGIGPRTLVFNLKHATINKNIDIGLFACSHDEYNKACVVDDISLHLMFGELRGGIDPAGADEHWKTANTALERIRTVYANRKNGIRTSFVAAAIERNMAEEIFLQLSSHKLDMAANLTKSGQIYEYCKWMLTL